MKIQGLAPITEVWWRLHGGGPAIGEFFRFSGPSPWIHLSGPRLGKIHADGGVMGRDLAAVAAEGVDACVRADRVRATMLVAELVAALDVSHAAARPVCDLYEDALRELRDGRFDAARALFQALRTV